MTLSVDETLRSLAFAESLPESVITQLASLSSIEAIAAGTTLFREATVHHAFSIVVDGHVSLEMDVPGRGNLRILSLSTGDILAWSAILGHGRMTATAVAVTDVQLLAFHGEELRRMCEANHEVGFHLMSRVATALSRRLLATRLQLLDLFATQNPVVDPLPKV